MRLISLALLSLLWAAGAYAQSDPRAYDLRFALMPLTFQPGISASVVGSAARAEYDPARRWTLQLAGRVPWATAAGEGADPVLRPAVRAGMLFHLREDVRRESEDVTVRLQDASVVSPPVTEAGHDVRTVNQRLGSPRMQYPGGDGPRDRELGVRHMHSLRLFYDYVQAVERILPSPTGEEPGYALNRRHMVSLGYGFGSQWNASPELRNEEHEVGFKRYYIDVMLSPAGFGSQRTLSSEPGSNGRYFPLGARIGLEGALCGVLSDMPNLGLAYTLELGVLPGESGLEGYLFLGLGIELDAALAGER